MIWKHIPHEVLTTPTWFIQLVDRTGRPRGMVGIVKRTRKHFGRTAVRYRPGVVASVGLCLKFGTVADLVLFAERCGLKPGRYVWLGLVESAMDRATAEAQSALARATAIARLPDALHLAGLHGLAALTRGAATRFLDEVAP